MKFRHILYYLKNHAKSYLIHMLKFTQNDFNLILFNCNAHSIKLNMFMFFDFAVSTFYDVETAKSKIVTVIND